MILDVDDLLEEESADDSVVIRIFLEYHRIFHPYWAGWFVNQEGRIDLFFAPELVKLAEQDYEKLCQKARSVKA